MNKFCVLSIVLFLLPLTGNSQNKNARNVENDILQIRHEYQRINSLKLTKKQFTWSCEATGTITYYLHNEQILKTIEEGAIGDGSWVIENYYQSGRIIFIYEVTTVSIGSNPDTHTEERTYVLNDKVIKHMNGQKVTQCKVCGFNTSSKEYKLLSAYSTKNFKNALCN